LLPAINVFNLARQHVKQLAVGCAPGIFTNPQQDNPMKIPVIILLLISVSALAGEVNMLEVKVLDNQSKLVRIINDKNELLKAQQAWDQLIPVKDLPNTNWTNQLDIKTNFVEGAWLYNKEGYIAKHNKYLEPKFKVKNIAEFNKIYLGL